MFYNEMMEDNSDYFPFMTKHNPERITCLIVSCLGIILGPIFLYSIIWFERFGSDKKRTLLNMLFSMTCWTALIFIICIQVPETFRYIYGPLPGLVCFIHLFLRYTLACMFMLFIDAFTVTRYTIIIADSPRCGLTQKGKQACIDEGISNEVFRSC